MEMGLRMLAREVCHHRQVHMVHHHQVILPTAHHLQVILDMVHRHQVHMAIHRQATVHHQVRMGIPNLVRRHQVHMGILLRATVILAMELLLAILGLMELLQVILAILELLLAMELHQATQAMVLPQAILGLTQAKAMLGKVKVDIPGLLLDILALLLDIQAILHIQAILGLLLAILGLTQGKVKVAILAIRMDQAAVMLARGNPAKGATLRIQAPLHQVTQLILVILGLVHPVALHQVRTEVAAKKVTMEKVAVEKVQEKVILAKAAEVALMSLLVACQKTPQRMNCGRCSLERVRWAVSEWFRTRASPS